MLEYSQRLKMQKRVVISEKNESNGRSLFDKALISGAKAGSRKSGKLEKGYWADFMSININKFDRLICYYILKYHITYAVIFTRRYTSNT